MGVLLHALGADYNPVIKVDYKSHRTHIMGDIIKLLRLDFRGLDGPEISSKDQHNRRSHRCVGMMLCLSYSLRISTHVNSIPHFISICCISVIKGIFTYLSLVRLLQILGRSLLAYFTITFSTIDTLSFLSFVDLTYSEYCRFPDGKMVGKIQHGQPVS